MITVIGYKNGQEIRRELCYDVMWAETVADELMESQLYDNVKIVTTEETK